MILAMCSAQQVSVSTRTSRRIAWLLRMVLAATSLAHSGCLDLKEPSNYGDSGGTGGARSDAKPSGQSSGGSGGTGSGRIGSGGSGGISGLGGNAGSGGDIVDDASGLGGDVDAPQGGLGELGDSGVGGSLDALTVETAPGMDGVAVFQDVGNIQETASTDTTGVRDAIPEVTADVATDAVSDAGNAPLSTGLVLYYPCEQADGTSLADMSGNGNNGTIHTATEGVGSPGSGYVFSGGKVGNALTLAQAESAYVSLPSWIFTSTVDLTIATWVRLNSLTARQRLFDVGSNANLSQDTATGTAYAALVLKNMNGKLGLSSTKNGYGSALELTTDTFSTGVWKHVAVVFGGGAATLYIDGAVVSTFSSIIPPQALGINYAFIGKSQFASDPFIDAQIDEFRVYDRALSAGEIHAVFQYAGP